MAATPKAKRNKQGSVVPGSSWGQQIEAAALRIEGRMARLTGHRPTTDSDDPRTADDPESDGIDAVQDELALARRITVERPRWPGHRVGEWWSGRRIETAWTHIREAELRLVECGPDDPRFQQVNLDHAAVDARFLSPDDPARVEFEALFPLPVAPAPIHPARTVHPKPAPPVDPVPAIQAVLEASFRSRNKYHGEARALRNRLIVVTLLVLLIAGGLVVAQLFIPQAHVLPRPKGDRGARWVTMLLVMLFGALGALLTAIPVMAALPRVPSPYNFPLQQSLMKIAVGTLTGLVGVVVIGAPVTTGGSSFAALVGAAIVFGAGQQVVTRFLDTRARQVIAAIPTLNGSKSAGG